MKFTFLFRGRQRDDPFQEGIEDYVARINRSFPTEVLSGKKERKISQFLNHRPRGSYIIGLEDGGKGFTSLEFAQFLQGLMERGIKEVIFLVGDADGFGLGWREKCDTILSLSLMTFSHQLARLVLLEQVYRALSIIQHRPYHR
ncbi:MAG: 23S rRNA (pseudouridine(1915)-N(3))-methyltransferase RlmH [Deltaproteobacteria bacterium]|nr:MAG: 23S rRNA (pseudouridine(1915)-N(3))-methyltransferase RlmH [Deltaproteobacteria bacterium]